MTYQTRETESQRDSGLKLSVDLERCVRCGKCEKVCPTGAIMVDEDIFRVDSSRCNECRQCVDRCPADALFITTNSELEERDKEGRMMALHDEHKDELYDKEVEK